MKNLLHALFRFDKNLTGLSIRIKIQLNFIFFYFFLYITYVFAIISLAFLGGLGRAPTFLVPIINPPFADNSPHLS